MALTETMHSRHARQARDALRRCASEPLPLFSRELDLVRVHVDCTLPFELYSSLLCILDSDDVRDSPPLVALPPSILRDTWAVPSNPPGSLCCAHQLRHGTAHHSTLLRAETAMGKVEGLRGTWNSRRG